MRDDKYIPENWSKQSATELEHIAGNAVARLVLTNKLKMHYPSVLYTASVVFLRELAKYLGDNPDVTINTLAAALKGWKLDIEGFVGFERAVVTSGGVDTEAIVAKSLEARDVPGLYFAGEVLDIDADTGGYNLQLAFSTGHQAGQSAALSLVQ